MTLNIKIVKPYLHLMRLDRPIGTLLLLWPTLIALWLASNGHPDTKLIVIFVLGVILMRAAGCVFNDYADRDFDPFVSRTKARPLATGVVKPKQAMLLFSCLMAGGLALALHLSRNTIVLAFVGAILILIYPFAKRFTSYPQLILGLAFAWGIPMAYMEVQGGIPLETWLLYSSVLFWVVAYDTQYAMVDKTDDLRIGIKSTAITFGNYDKAIILGLHLLMLTGMLLIGIGRNLGNTYFIGLIITLGLVIYQQILIKDRNPKNCFKAFLNNNYIGAIIFCSLILR
jgi:4-hydroxybenzoate polyprenyltransferase